MRRIFFVILTIPAILISCLSSMSAYSDTISSNSFEVIISLDKETYIEGEDIWLKVVFKNISQKIDSIAMLNEAEVYTGLRVRSKEGITSWYKGAIINSAKYYTKFQPGEQREFNLELRATYGLRYYTDSGNTTALGVNPYFPKGEYKVYLKFNVDEDKREIIKSNEVTFMVKEPKGIELEAFNEMIRIFKLKFDYSTSSEEEERNANEYMKFIKKYPNSVYLGKVFSLILVIRTVGSINYDDTYVDDCYLFIEMNPNSYHINAAVYGIAGYYKDYINDKEKAIEHLEKIKRKYPNTIASEKVEEILSKEEYRNNK